MRLLNSVISLVYANLKNQYASNVATTAPKLAKTNVQFTIVN